MDPYRPIEEKETEIQLELFYERGTFGNPNWLWIRDKGRIQVKIFRR